MDTADDIFVRPGHTPVGLRTALEDALRLTVERADVGAGSIWLRDLGTLVVGREGRRTVTRWVDSQTPAAERIWVAPGQASAASCNASATTVRRSTSGLSAPVSFADVVLGEVWLDWPSGDAARRAAGHALAHSLARQCGYLAQRHTTCQWAEERLGRPLLLVGTSPAMRQLAAFVERAAVTDLPVLLSGEFGTETAVAAAEIHACGPWRDGPFIQVHCTDPEGDPGDWVKRADGGTLLLSDVDALPMRWQFQLPRSMHSHLNRRVDAPAIARPRIIATTTANLHQLVREGVFSRALLAELDFLAATVPPLREREGDLPALLAAALARQGCRPEGKIGAELVEICSSYSWPENLFELERVVARLAVMSTAAVIGRADVMRYTPWILPGAQSPVPVLPPPAEWVDDWRPAAPPGGPSSDTVAETAGRSASPSSDDADGWVDLALTPVPQQLSRLHPGLRKALIYLGANYTESVSMETLARNAHVSPSHLSFLFRSELGISSKTLLGRIRIRRAQEIMRAEPRQPITEVALQVGFIDLSHFEKSFRRIVGQSPREFRRDL